MYLNFDMVASPNYGLFAYDGDGSDFGLVGPPTAPTRSRRSSRSTTPTATSRRRPRPSTGGRTTRRSSSTTFPRGGLFTGAEGIKTAAQAAKWGGTAGVAYDPCYHAECDTIDNLSHKALDINSDAIAYVVYLYASGKRAINAG